MTTRVCSVCRNSVKENCSSYSIQKFQMIFVSFVNAQLPVKPASDLLRLRLPLNIQISFEVGMKGCHFLLKEFRINPVSARTV